MTKREFNSALKSISSEKSKKVLEDRIPGLTTSVREGMVKFIVRTRGPVLRSLIPVGFDVAWLNCMGYLHQTTGKESGMTFVHTSAHSIT